MSSHKIQINDLFFWTLESDKPYIVHQGGTSSGKTYAILQYLISIASKKKDLTITVVGQDIPNLRVGAYRDAQNIIYNDPFFTQELTDHNKSNRVFTFSTGSKIEFNSYNDEIDARSGKRTHSFFNEANGIDYGIFEQISMRTTQQTIIDFNPSAAFWAHDKLQGRDDVDWFVSTYRDNYFIQPSIKNKILSYQPTPENIKAGTANQYRWQVYGLGEVGRLEGLVFPNFETTNEWPENYKWRCFGLDWGYTNDPTALVEIRYNGGALYWKEHIYKRQLTNQYISRLIKELGVTDEIVADSAEPKSIAELRNSGVWVKPAKKGKDSVMFGIQLLQDYPIKIHAQSKNLIEEFSSYTWAKDRSGQPTNKPIDDFNHGIDAGRYAIIDRMKKKTLDISLA
jgi:phage terminase large subunit